MSFRVFLRLSLSLFLFYTILRLDFWFWNRSLFSEETFFTLAKAFFLGLRFDAVAVSWSLLPLLIWGWVFRRAYWIPLFLMIVPLYFLNFTDIELWSFFGRRLSLSTLLLFSEAQGKAGAMASQYLGWIAVGFVTLLPAFYCLWVSSFNAEKLKVNLRGGKFWAEQLVLVILLVIGSRGGLQHKPISPITAQLFDKSHLNLLALNSTFTLGKSLKGSSLNKERHFQNPEQALALVNSAVDSKPLAFSFSRPQNVVLLIVESLSWEYIEGGHTPFLSDLMKRSLTFSRAMANGRRSIEGVAALLSGVPSLMEEPFITSEFSTNQIVGLASVFQKNGYRSFFYHGGENGTMHFDSFAQKAGFEFYYGARQYPHPEDHDGV